MDIDAAVGGFGALSTQSRLAVLKLLADAPHEGMPSGEIAAALKVPQNTVSTQLQLLLTAKLVRSQRVGRQIIYRVNLETMRGLIEYLAQQCAGRGLKVSVRETPHA